MCGGCSGSPGIGGWGWGSGMTLPRQGPRDLSPLSKNPDTSPRAVWVKVSEVTDVVQDDSGVWILLGVSRG